MTPVNDGQTWDEGGAGWAQALRIISLKQTQYQEVNMDISRRLGILVFFGVPAIIGGGIVYAIFGSLTPMWIYEALLLVVAGALVSR